MSLHDDGMLDDVAALALGVLPAMQAQAVAQHVRECADCQALYAELRPAANLLGYAAEASPAQDELAAARRKSRTMAAVRATLAPPVGARNAARHPAYLPWGVAAAAVILAAGAFAQNATLRRDSDHAAQTASYWSSREASFESVVALAIAPEAKHFAVPHGEVITSSGRVIVALRNLPPPPPHKVYQTWTLATGAKTVAPGVTFLPDRNGIALVELQVSAANVAAVALSLEPVGGSRAPTTKPAFVRKLS